MVPQPALKHINIYNAFEIYDLISLPFLNWPKITLKSKTAHQYIVRNSRKK